MARRDRVFGDTQVHTLIRAAYLDARLGPVPLQVQLQ